MPMRKPDYLVKLPSSVDSIIALHSNSLYKYGITFVSVESITVVVTFMLLAIANENRPTTIIKMTDNEFIFDSVCFVVAKKSKFKS